MILYLVDPDIAVVDAWRIAFADVQDVHISHGNVLASAAGTIVSPANSFGFMDGGIDACYAEFFGMQIESRVRDAILARNDQSLPVGASLVVETGHSKITSMIVAPTMVMPEPIPRENCYRAFRAALRVTNDPLVAESVYCPGIGTGVGMINPTAAAKKWHGVPRLVGCIHIGLEFR